jgi:prephenate dehydrogenase
MASGPANIWADVLVTNASNVVGGIDRIILELAKIRKDITRRNKKQIETMLKAARRKRAVLINYKMKRRELIP